MKSKKNKKTSKILSKRLWAVWGALIFIFGFSFVYLTAIYSPIKNTAHFDLTAGLGVNQVASTLWKNDMIASKRLFRLANKFFGGQVQIGTYEFPTGTSVWGIARMTARGQVASVTIMIPEGTTVKQIIAILNSNSSLVGNVCDICPGEGELFPDTYTVAKKTPRSAVLELMRKKMQGIKTGWEASGKHAPAPLKSWNEIVTLASIVQKETPRVSEMPIVASVYLNRLRTGMRLQADPTVVYQLTEKLGDMQGQPLLRGHLKIDNPYNTYTRYGLPPGPIANVGSDAIAAVLNPADTDFYFFVADGTGGHKFSKDYEEHKINHAAWRKIRKN